MPRIVKQRYGAFGVMIRLAYVGKDRDMAPTVVSRASWGARAPKSPPSLTTWSNRVGVAVHHSAGNVNTTPRQIQDGDMDQDGFSDIGYNFLVNQDGTAYEGRSGGWLAIGAHAGGQNTGWIGICWIGNSGNVAPTQAALATIKGLYQEANRLAGRTLQVRGHGQVPGQATECPGSRLRSWIANGLPTQGDDMALEESDLKAIWNADGIVTTPTSARREPAHEDNTHWSPSTFLRSIRDALHPATTEEWLGYWDDGPNAPVGVGVRRAAIESRRTRVLVEDLHEKVDGLQAPGGLTPPQLEQLLEVVRVQVRTEIKHALENITIASTEG